MGKIELVRAVAEDAEALWNMQKIAFAEMLEKYRDYDTSPAAEPLSKTVGRLNQPSSYFYFICADGIRVGALRIVAGEGRRRKKISPLFVLPEYRKRGYASRAVSEAEKLFGGDGWELDTVMQEKSTCEFYERLGYVATGESKAVNENLTLVYYEK